MKGLERKIEQYSLPHQKEQNVKYRTEIDLNKMSSLGRIIYLQSLLKDASETIKELRGDLPTYDYIESTIEHLDQAVIDLRKVKAI